MDSRRPGLAWIGVVVAAAVVFVALRAPLVSLPLERDEGEYAYIAQRMAAGEVPYRDAFDQKPPAVFAVYRVALWLFGDSVAGIRVLLGLWSAATAALLYALARRLADREAAAFSVLVFAVTATDPRLLAQAANTELFMLLPIVASLVAALRGLERGAAWWIASGFLAGLACWFKQVAAVHALLLLVLALLARAVSARERALRVSGLGVGALAAAVPVVAVFVAADAWAPFFDAVVLHNLAYAARVPWETGLPILIGRLSWQAPTFAVVWLAAGVAVVAPGWVWSGSWQAERTRRSWGIAVGWLATSALGVAAGFYFRPHYFVQWVPALSLLAGVSFGALARWVGARSGAWGAAVRVGLVAAVVAPAVFANHPVLFAESPAAASRWLYGANPFPESVEIGRYIRERSEPSDEIYIIGSEPQIFFYAARRSASRYIFFYPLTGVFPDARERQLGVIEEVGRRRPLYVVWVNVGTSLTIAEKSEKEIFRSGAHWLRRRYRLEYAALWDAERGDYEFASGDEARSRIDAVDEDLAGHPWVAVFRRAR